MRNASSTPIGTTVAGNLPPTTDIAAKLKELAERAKKLNEDAESLANEIELTQQARMARGTRDKITPPTGVQLPKVSRALPTVNGTELYAHMTALLSKRPMTLQELMFETKAEPNKVKVVLLTMQRENAGLENMGNRYRALWFIPSPAFRARMHAEAKAHS